MRISSGEYERLNSLRLEKAYKYVLEINEYELKLDSIIQNLCNSIYHIIPSIKRKEDRDILIESKRDIYNRRNVSSEASEKILNYIKEETSVKEYCKYIDLIEEKKEGLGKIFVKKQIKAENNFKKLTEEENFKKGLLLSSQELFDLAEKKYWINLPRKNRTYYSIQQGFSKYISRIYTKTSPFSTFTHIGFGNIESIQNKKLIFEDTSRANFKSVIKPNNYLFKHLFNLMQDVRPFLYNYQVSLNTSINLEQNNQLKYFTNRGNTEAIQSIENASTLISLYQFIQNHDKIKFINLLKFAKKNSNASKLEIESFLKKLYQIEFLELQISNISEVNKEWIKNLRKWLLSFEVYGGIKQKFLTFLKTLEDSKDEYVEADSQNRKKLQMRAFLAFKNFNQDLLNFSTENNLTPKKSYEGGKAFFSYQPSSKFSFQPNDIFYEDSVIVKRFRVNKSLVLRTIKTLDRLLKLISPFELQYQKKIALTNYFLKTYGKEKKVDLLDFYENYQRNGEKNEVNSNFKLSKLLFEKFDSSKDVINVDLSKIEKITENFFEEHRNPDQVSSHAIFLQFYKNKGNSYKSVLNGIYPGFGKMFSRFLESNQPETKRILSDNIRLMGNNIWAENKDASYFNANVHPHILPYEISIPGGHNNHDKEKRINLRNLIVKYCESTSHITLYDRVKKKRVNVFDLSFQAQDGRSDLYQFLEHFSHTQYYNLGIVLREMSNRAHLKLKNQKNNQEYQVVKIPRIELENQVILSRMLWYIPKEILPKRQTNEEQSDYFLKLNRWFLEHGLPSKFFVYVIYSRAKTELEDDILDTLNADDYKPQYISLDIPFFVDIFSDICKKVPRILKITEMLPDEENMIEINGNKRVSEFLFQWNSHNNI
ncbi:hypothetical protein BH23THE1_BH23THE1_14680 [soil metagenome]